jgi:hypothetical protein
MWVPRSEQEIEGAAAGGLVESDIFDAKEQLPTNSLDLAIDVAAMATGGGVLLYGVGEDGAGRPTVLRPFKLKGARERVDQIIRAGVSEPPYYQLVPIDSPSHAGAGYLAVLVPASERAPHMVVVKGENRYYRRVLSGNVPMTEAEVASLYARRQLRAEESARAVATDLRQEVIPPSGKQAFMKIVMRPVASPPDLLTRASGSSVALPAVLQAVAHALAWTFPSSLMVNGSVLSANALDGLRSSSTWRRTADGWSTAVLDGPHGQKLELIARNDGTIVFFSSRIGEVPPSGGPMWIFRELPPAYLVRMCQLAGKLHALGGYYGAVDVGVRLTGILGSVPHSGNAAFQNNWPYSEPSYERTGHIAAGQLLDDWMGVGRTLLSPFLNAQNQGTYDPFAETT